jgi:hypothetical protein
MKPLLQLNLPPMLPPRLALPTEYLMRYRSI